MCIIWYYLVQKKFYHIDEATIIMKHKWYTNCSLLPCLNYIYICYITSTSRLLQSNQWLVTNRIYMSLQGDDISLLSNSGLRITTLLSYFPDFYLVGYFIYIHYYLNCRVYPYITCSWSLTTYTTTLIPNYSLKLNNILSSCDRGCMLNHYD